MEFKNLPILTAIAVVEYGDMVLEEKFSMCRTGKVHFMKTTFYLVMVELLPISMHYENVKIRLTKILTAVAITLAKLHIKSIKRFCDIVICDFILRFLSTLSDFTGFLVGESHW